MSPPPAQAAGMATAFSIFDELNPAYEAAMEMAQAQMEAEGDTVPVGHWTGEIADWLARRREKARGIMIATNVSAVDPNYEPPPPVRPPTRPRSAPLVRLPKPLPNGWGGAVPPVMQEIHHAGGGMGTNGAHWPPLPVPGGGATMPLIPLALILQFAVRTAEEDRRLRAHSSNNRRWICTCMHACMLATFT